MARGLLRSKFRFRTSKHNAGRRGSFAPEFALLAPPFFLLLMGIVEFCLLLGAQQVLEHVAFSASRLAKTGYVANEMNQEQTINQVLVTELSSYGTLLDPMKLVMTVENFQSFTGAGAGGGAQGFGTEEQIVTYNITYPWKLFTPLMCEILGSACQTGGIFNLNTTIVVRNEPYG